MRENKKPIIIGILCSLIVVMAIGYALLSQELTINGTSRINATWNIRISNIEVTDSQSAYSTPSTSVSGDVSGSTGCTTQTASNNGCNSTTANFETKLITPGDYVTYTVTVTNSGTIQGVVESINLTCSQNDAIECEISGLTRGDTIAANGGTNTFDVTVRYNSNTSTQPASTTSDITVAVNYQQNLGQVEAPTPTYTAYSVGDTIQYKGSNWRVIKNSSASEDYVTLMKETALTGIEIGASYVKGGNTSNNFMAYYWSSTCHEVGTYGGDAYNSSDDSGCSGHNDYAGSKIKQVVDNYMTTNNMMNDLKEIDGYKIRLITLNELQENLGLSSTFNVSWYDFDSQNTPNWVDDRSVTNVYTYWTMTPDVDNTIQVWDVGSSQANSRDIRNGYFLGEGVRPVINLLKTAIPPQS